MSKYITEKPEIVCFNCTKPDYYCDHVECFEVPNELIENYDDFSLPFKCGMYMPVKVKKCKYCESQIEGYYFNHKYWFETGECGYPICQECYVLLSDETLDEHIHCTC